ncbi:hypothetical protein C8R47DRAFT_1099971 [Mycena vitilis]|nr:hypothetical protein C8R47DRAFT_1099971 [Mycena vitilis]
MALVQSFPSPFMSRPHPRSLRPLLIHLNVSALLLPSMAQLLVLIWLDPPTMKAALVSSVLAISANVALCVLSGKYGLTTPGHEAGAAVVTAHVACATFTDPPFWTVTSPFPYIYIMCAIPITRSIHFAVLGLAGLTRSGTREAKLPTWVGESEGLLSIVEEDSLHDEKPLAGAH